MIDLKVKPTLVGKKVILRPFIDEDFPYLEECLKDPEVLKFTGISHEFDREEIICNPFRKTVVERLPIN